MLQPAQLALRLRARFLRQAGLVDAAAQLLQLLLLALLVAQLLADRLELLAQHVLALGAGDLLLHLAADPLAHAQALALADEDLGQPLHAAAHVERGQQRLARRGRDLDQRRGDHVGQRAVVGDVARQHDQVVRHAGRVLHHVLEQVEDVAMQRGVDRVAGRGVLAGQAARAHARIRLGLQLLDDGDPLEALEHQHGRVASVAQMSQLAHHRAGPDLVELAR